MASNAPYYQSVQAPNPNVADELKLSQSMLDYSVVAPAASMYPDPNQPQDYHLQHIADNDTEDHAQLQGLVEAATSAAAQEQIRQRNQMAAFAAQHDTHPDPSDQALATLLRDNTRPSKRKRSGSPNNNHDTQLNGATAASERPKRQKRATFGGPEPQGHEGDLGTGPYQNNLDSPVHLDARAAGVHSAAALFRPPSDSSKKYTRPPMSKLFTSLELSPENFLYLQAAAKSYMLDPDEPDRQACVGNRGRGDSDMVKLKLHHCVREFLDERGWGEKYFGENAPPPGEGEAGTLGQHRQFVWPRDKDRIIALCTPLLRRMVTNERQRQYAVESRSKGAKGDKPAADVDGVSDAQATGPESMPPNAYDPSLGHSPGYQIYLLDRESKQMIRDRVDLPSDDNIDWHYIVDVVQRSWCEALNLERLPPDIVNNLFDTLSVKVLTSGGLTTVSSEGEWQLAFQDMHQTPWLEGTAKVIVDCATQI